LWLLLLQLLLGITTIPIALPVTTIRATGVVQGVVLLVPLANHLVIMATVASRTTHNSVGSEATKVAAAAGGESQAAVDAHEN
jgi:hypothetical protein